MSGLGLGPGDRYESFQIIELIGRGAFASVYRVRTPDRASAALKLSLRPVGDSDESRRALREIAVLQTLTNHHVVRVFEAGYGAGEARLWLQRWRMFYMAVAELFGYRGGSEWGVAHYRFERR